MLFNTLANLRSLVREDVDRAESMIDQLIVYLRSALAASQTESVTLSREFAQLRAYLDIMALRMGPRLSFRLELPAALEATLVPPMLLQPLVENAIKHGLEPKVGAGPHRGGGARDRRGHRDPRRATAAWVCPRTRAIEPARPPRRRRAMACSMCGTGCTRVYGPTARLSLERRQPTGVCAVVFIPT